ncbi:MAG: hypothetical protein M5U34_21975 [Chloroflexi bacterium]|nr:hypothetical protein [Chloroflexota bacterium]
MLPQVKAFQQRRSAATFGGLPVLTAPEAEEAQTTINDSLLNDPNFNRMVRDAPHPLLGRT